MTALFAFLQSAPDGARFAGKEELSAALLQLALTLGIAWVCATLHRVYRRPFYAWWTAAWILYVLRLAAIVTFLIRPQLWTALFVHQVLTGWTALAILGTATVFVRGGVRWWFAVAAAFPPLWSYFAIYQLNNFQWAAVPAVLFLSAATLSTGAVFWLYARRARSLGASVLAVAFMLWGLHHLDYPFLRERGEWVPWGYYLDILFELAVGVGILLLVADDLRRGIEAMTTLSGELQAAAPRARTSLLDALLTKPLTLPAVRGAALYTADRGVYERGAGVCETWGDRAPSAAEQKRLEATLQTGKAATFTSWSDPDAGAPHPFAALLPIPQSDGPSAALVVVGDARTPFAVLDERFLTALGQQVAAAIANSALTERLRQRTTDLERLSSRMIQQHEEERRRLSRELHDETAQVLSALKIELGVLRRVMATSEQHRVDEALILVDAGIRSIRAVTNELRPALLDDLGLVPALRSLVTEFASRTGLHAELALPLDRQVPTLTADAELALFRALQEGLANVVRHAEAHEVHVTLAARNGRVELTVADDGVGFAADAREKSAMGLTGMRERVAALGGSMTIDSAARQGTTLRITLMAQDAS